MLYTALMRKTPTSAEVADLQQRFAEISARDADRGKAFCGLTATVGINPRRSVQAPKMAVEITKTRA